MSVWFNLLCQCLGMLDSTRFGLYAQSDIEIGEELTVDYMYETMKVRPT